MLLKLRLLPRGHWKGQQGSQAGLGWVPRWPIAEPLHDGTTVSLSCDIVIECGTDTVLYTVRYSEHCPVACVSLYRHLLQMLLMTDFSVHKAEQVAVAW